MKRSLLLFAGLCLIMCLSLAQNKKNTETPLIGSEAPAFTAISTHGTLNFPNDFGDSWKILLSHPKDFTPVCSSELLELAHQQKEYKELGAKLIVVSTDKLDSHLHWKAALEEISYKGLDPVKINFPLVDDHQYVISKSYGMIHSQASLEENIRGVFIIDPDNKVRAIYFYPMEVGRNMEELKRTLIALQTNYRNQMALTPANWQPGEDVMVPFLKDEELAELGNVDSKVYQKAWFMSYTTEY